MTTGLGAAVASFAPTIGCTLQTMLQWIQRTEIDTGSREGVTTAEGGRKKALEAVAEELRQASQILKLASTFFAQSELDRRLEAWEMLSAITARPSWLSRSATFCRLPRPVAATAPPKIES